MNTLAIPSRISSPKLWTLASRFLFTLGFAAVLYFIVRIFAAALDGRFARFETNGQWWLVAQTAGVYLLGHGFRILRLTLLIGVSRVGFREVAAFQLMTAAVSLTAPFKLGELYRVFELSNLTGRLLRAIVIAWLERVFDALMIFIVLALALPKAMGEDFGAVTVLTGVFVLVTAIVLAVVPENLRRISMFIIRRYKQPQSVFVLRAIDTVRRAVLDVPSRLHNKVATLLILSALIWTCEITCFVLIVPGLTRSFDAAGAALLTFLSAETRGVVLLEQLQSGATMIFPYLAATQGPLIILGGLAALSDVRARFRS